MMRTALFASILALTACTTQKMATIGEAPDAAVPFAIESPAVYVAKVKNILVGLPPTDAEVQAVVKDPTALGGLVDGWMALPQYQEKMLVFFELAFQQTQITAADFVDMIPPNGIGNGPGVAGLVQNVRESFARTVLASVTAGNPLTDAFTTTQVMMTPALMELYAFLESHQVDDTGKVHDAFATNNPKQNIYLGTASGPIPIAQTLDPTNANYMHWYSPDVAGLMYPVAGCDVDPAVMKPSSYSIHLLLYGELDNHTVSVQTGNCGARPLTAASMQMVATDFTDWKLVTIRPPNAGEATTTFYDLPTLRSATELVLSIPRPGYFSTPAFFANWSTNTSNQMRVTLNQSLIVATGMAVDGTDKTTPPSTPGLDQEHAQSGQGCFGCHDTLDPTRSIMSATWSWGYSPQSDPALIAQPGLFAFQGVIANVSTVDEFATTLANHPAVPAAWAQKLCYYVNSVPCSTSDPEFVRIVSDFKTSKLSWNALVRDLVTSPITTNASETATAVANGGETIAVSRRDHLCAAINSRLGFTDICGLDALTVKKGTIPEIVAGLPSDGYGRGAPIPVLPNQPTLFYRAGLENICEDVAMLVVDPSTPTAGAKSWSSTQPDAAISDFVGTIMALVSSDPRSAQATTILKSHFTSAMSAGNTASNALRSTFIAACLAPSSIGIGM